MAIIEQLLLSGKSRNGIRLCGSSKVKINQNWFNRSPYIGMKGIESFFSISCGTTYALLPWEIVEQYILTPTRRTWGELEDVWES